MPIFAAVMAVISLAMSVYALSQQMNFDQDDTGVDIPDAGANKGLNFVYGNSRVQCNKVFEDVATASGKETREGDWLSIVAAGGQGPFNALKQIYLNGTPVLNDFWKQSNKYQDMAHGTIGKEYISERFKNHVQIQFNMGQKDFFYQMINDLHPTKWDSSCVGSGIASVALRILRDPYKGEIQNSPQIEIEVEGRLLTDIRRENSEPAYDTLNGCVGTNPALAFLDYLTSPYGCNFSYDSIDEYSFADKANLYDKEKTYINGVVDQKRSVADNIKQFEDDFLFKLIKSANKWKLISWHSDAVAESFTEDDILDSDINYKWGSSKTAFNRLQVEFAVAKNNFQKDILAYPTLTDDELLDRDGHIVNTKVDLNFVTSKEQVDRYASIYYETMRKLGVLTFTGNEKAYNCEIGDIVEVTLPQYQFNKKLFRVMKVKRSTSVNETAIAQLGLAEYNAAAYDIKHVADQSNATTLPERFIPEPHNLRFDVVAVGDAFTGLLKWDRVNCWDFMEYVVEYKLSSQPESEWAYYGKTENSEMYISNLHGAFYDFRIFTRTKFMKHSPFAFLYKVDVNDDTILPTVTGLRLVTTNKDITVTDSQDFTVMWDSMDDVAVTVDKQMLPNATGAQTVKSVKRGYEVEISHGTNGTYKETVITLEPKFTYTFAHNAKNGLNRNVQFSVKILSKGGAKSKIPAVLKAKNEQCKAPTGVSIKGAVYGLESNWVMCTESDYRATRLYANTQKGFVPTDADLLVDEPCNFFHKMDIKKQVWYVRLAHYDVFGTDDLNFTEEFRISPSNIVDEMTSMKEDIGKEHADAIRGVTAETDTKIQNTKKELNATLSASAKTQQEKLDAEIKERGAAVLEATNTISDLKTKVANDVKELKTQLDDNTADIKETNSTLTAKDKTYTERFVKLETSTKANNAKIEEVNNTLTDATNAQAESTKKLEASINGVSGTVTQQAKTIATMDGEINNIQSQYTISVQAGNKVAGISLIGKSGTVSSSSLAFGAEQILFWDPEAKNNKPFMEYRNGKLRVVNLYVDDISSGQIMVGAINASHIQTDALTSRHIQANIQLRTPDIMMDKIRLNAGAAGFGKGQGPYDGWGEKWSTIIYANGTLCTNNINASGGNINNLKVDKCSITNCVIEEDCTVKGFLYADRIIGMPAGKSSGLSSQWLPFGAWVTVLGYDVATTRGRFDVYTMPQLRGSAVGYTYGPAPNVGGYLYCNLGVRVLVNGNEIYREVIDIEHNWEIIGPRIFSWCGNRINCGSNGANIQIQICGVATNRITNNHHGTHSDTFAYDNKYSGREADVWVQSLNAMSYSCIDL
ncbi:phage tail protein [Aeromonas hydrophila]|uniref:phage tail protein n=1 Tax=Aeromonas hydrophila TaxID=644 RepID=UPI00259E0EEB|nr:phage tail protein [Aeromonas hydrophila]MDM5121013.1 DUF1983 domain-containing protein [Aeromonas hydrophila]